MQFNTIEEVIEDIGRAKMVIIIDDESRENEGDLIMSASFVTPADINFMAKHGRGLICVPLCGKRLDALDLHPMVREGSDPYKTDWAVSVDAKEGVTTGISAHDRARTIKVLIDPQTKPHDLSRPGHIFPLRAKQGGVLVRAGHTEACVDLMNLAGLYPAGVICEIMNEDGTMARTEELMQFARRHNLKICTIQDLIHYRRTKEKLIRRAAASLLPTDYGTFKLIAYESIIDKVEHLALVMGLDTGDEKQAQAVLVRVHSECLTGEALKSQRCDCGEQLHRALSMIGEEGKGVLIYMRQEGRGIGLLNKIHAYELQDQGLDTVEANEVLGFAPDLRNYGIGAQILADLGLRNIRLLTNNPRKVVGLEGYGLRIVERVPLKVEANTANQAYLETKKNKLGHLL